MQFTSAEPNLVVETPVGTAKFIDGTYETDNPELVEALTDHFAEKPSAKKKTVKK